MTPTSPTMPSPTMPSIYDYRWLDQGAGSLEEQEVSLTRNGVEFLRLKSRQDVEVFATCLNTQIQHWRGMGEPGTMTASIALLLADYDKRCETCGLPCADPWADAVQEGALCVCLQDKVLYAYNQDSEHECGHGAYCQLCDRLHRED